MLQHQLIIYPAAVLFLLGLPDWLVRPLTGRPGLRPTLRVLTPFGSDRFDPNYGLDVKQAFTAPNSTRIVKELLRLNLVSTLTADPRVSAVRRVTFDDDPDRLAADPDGGRIARISRKWTVVVELETATGATATLLANVEV